MKKDQGSDSLYRLVQSLDANERGYVKKFLKRHSDRGNVNLDLVEALEKQSEYNETALKKQFKNLAVVKVQAWDEILDALRIYNKKEFTFEKSNVTDQVAILLKKGLKNEAQKLHLKYIEKYTEDEEFLPLIGLLPTSIDIYDETRSGKNHADFFYDTMTDTISAVQKLKEKFEYHREAGTFYYLQVNKNQENYLEKVERFKSNSLLFDKEPSTKAARLFYYDMNAFYYSAIGDNKQHLNYLEKSNVLTNENCEKKNNYGRFFWFSNANLAGLYILHGEYKKAQKVLDYLDEITAKNKMLLEQKEAVTLLLQMALYNRSQETKALRKFIEENEKGILVGTQSQQRIEGANQFKIEYLISILLLEKHTEALRWILECDNDKTFRTDDINYQLVLVIEIVLNYVLGDFETAQKEAKKYAKNKEFQLIELFEVFTISDKKKRYAALKDAMKNTKEKSNLLLEYFDVFDWIMKVLK